MIRFASSRPTTCSRRRPKVRSAAGLKLCTVPLPSIVMMQSSAESTIEALVSTRSLSASTRAGQRARGHRIQSSVEGPHMYSVSTSGRRRLSRRSEATRFRSTPMPSISSSTSSPGSSQRPSPCSRMQPPPTVPDPITSPARSPGVLRAAAASDLLPGPVDRAGARVGPHLAVHARDRAHVESVRQLVGGHQLGAERGGEVLALGRPQPDRHLLALEVARRPVVHDREALDAALRPDHRGQLELVVEHRGVGRLGHLVAVAVDRGGVREVEDGDLVPGVAAPPPGAAARALRTCSSKAKKSRIEGGWRTSG